MPKRKRKVKVLLFLEELENRVTPSGTVTVPLDPTLDQFGNQIGTVQAYGDSSRATFGIFDTGASAVTFSPDDADLFNFSGNPIPIKVPGGAGAGGIGGQITGDVSQPGIILAAGMHAETITIDNQGFPNFSTNFDATSASTPNIQAFVGTQTGSPDLPTITGTPILHPSATNPGGLAARIDLQGTSIDFSSFIPGLVLTEPDLNFVAPGTKLKGGTGLTDPIYVPLGTFGNDTYANSGNAITEAPSPMQNNVSVFYTPQIGNPTESDHNHFLLDTGSQLTVISPTVAASLGLDLGHPDSTIDVQGVAGTETVPGFTLSKLELPTTDPSTFLDFSNVPVYVLDVAPGVDGLLGMNLFDTASTMLYDPYNPSGATLGVTFNTDPTRGLGDTTQMGLDLLAPSSATLLGYRNTNLTILPTATFSKVSPATRTNPVNSLTFDFSEPVASVSLSNLQLTRNGVNVNLQGATLTHTKNQTTWTIGNLSGLSGTDGVYQLKLGATGPAIQDYNGASLVSAASTSWTMDTVAPTIALTTIGGDTNNHRPTLSASAADNTGGSGMASVQFQILANGGTTWQNAGTAQTVAPFNYTFIAGLTDGSYQARAVATDKAGNSATSAPVSFKELTIDHFAVLPTTTAAKAGVGFALLIFAQDVSNNTVNYNGSITITSNDPLTPSQGTVTLNNGIGAGNVTLDTATQNGWTLQVTAGPLTSTSSAITVSAGTVTGFIVTAPVTATTGNPFNITVKAQDHFGNTAAGYTGTIKFSSTDSALTSINNYTFTGSGPGHDNGVHVFTGAVTLNTPGTQTITAGDTTATNPPSIGVSNTVLTRGLTVTSLLPSATGFTAIFSKTFLPTDLTLYGPNLTTAKDVTLIGAHVGPIHGSLVIDPSALSFTFNATSSYLLLKNSTAHPATVSAILPDDTYTVMLLSASGTNGFQDVAGESLDGLNNAGHANYTTTFTTSYQNTATPALGIPDLARGPDSGTPIKVPNDSSFGIPITLYNALNVTDVNFTLTYNPALLNITGTAQGITSDATDPNATFILGTISGGVATFTYHDANPKSGVIVLGDISAVVPDSAKNLYQAKELLQLGNIVINQGNVTGAISSNSMHVNAYAGDLNADGIIDGIDTLTANQVAIGKATGFAAFTQLDPAIIGDVTNDLSVDAGDVSALDLYAAKLHPAQIPVPPGLAVISPNAADPTLSLGESTSVIGEPRGVSPRVISVLLDHPHPQGSTGLTEAVLALTYDPTIFSVSPSDITLGSLPNQGTGWQLSSAVDQTTGQIGIELFSLTPITDTQAGSLVNITLHTLSGERRGVSPLVPPTTAVQLVNTVTPNGQPFATMVADSQGTMILSPGIDRVQISNDAVPVVLAINNEAPPALDTLPAETAPHVMNQMEVTSAVSANLGVLIEEVTIGIVPYASVPDQYADPRAGQVFYTTIWPVFNTLLSLIKPTDPRTDWLLMIPDNQAAVQPTESNRIALVDQVFAQMGIAWDEFG